MTQMRTMLILLAGSVLASTLLAQSPGTTPILGPGGTGRSQEPAGARSLAGTGGNWAQQIVNIKFPGGPAKTYIDAIRAAAAPAVINVVYGSEAAESMLPAIDLAGVTVFSAFEVIGQVDPSNGGNNLRAILITGNRAPTEAPVYRVEASGASMRPQPDVHRVLSLSEVLRTPGKTEGTLAISSAGALKAIETAIEVATGLEDPNPIIKFHEETGMLIIGGNKQQCEVAEEVVRNLTRDAQQTLSLLDRPAQSANKAKLADADRRFADLMAQRERERADLQDARARQEQIEVSLRAQIDDLTKQLLNARVQAEATRVSTEQFAKQIEALRDESAKMRDMLMQSERQFQAEKSDLAMEVRRAKDAMMRAEAVAAEAQARAKAASEPASKPK